MAESTSVQNVKKACKKGGINLPFIIYNYKLITVGAAVNDEIVATAFLK